MRKLMVIAYIALTFVMITESAVAAVRLKDIANVRDQRETQLVGYGLVVGLEGTGDGRNTQFTIRMIGNMIKRLGLDVPSTTIKVKNVAAVMVTARVSPYLKVNSSFDITVSSMGDATSLEGGTLLMTYLSDGSGTVYARAQGSLSVGGANKNYGSQGAIVPNAQNSGVISGGAILERDVPTLATDERSILVTLNTPDFTTAYRLATAINDEKGNEIATAQDAGSIVVTIPEDYASQGDLIRFIADIESVPVEPDIRARVVINERTGTVISGGNVSLGPVAISHGNLSLNINQGQAPQPGMQQAPAGDRMVAFGETTDVNEVSRALNLLGVTPRDLISIFQALKQSGSLRAELVIM